MHDLWERWEQHYVDTGLDPSRLCRDGIVCEESFQQARRKVLFVLRETNKFEDDLRTLLRRKDKGSTWQNVARWAVGILEDFPNWDSVNLKEGRRTRRKDALLQIAAINLKKMAGGSSIQPGQISAFAHHDRHLLREQIDLINPEVIVACGTMGPLIWLLDLALDPINPKNKPVKDSKGRVIVPFVHPNRKSAEDSYVALKNLVKS